MCLIIAKPDGVEPPSDSIIQDAYRHNKDGFGVAYTNGDAGQSVHIHKGALNLEEIKGILSTIKNQKKKKMIYHFRIATDGAICRGNCHPYPVTNNEELLQAQRVKATFALAHNGIISGVKNTECRPDTRPILPVGARVGSQNKVPGYWLMGKFTPLGIEDEDIMDYWSAGSRGYGKLNLKFTDTQIFVRDYLAPLGAMAGTDIINQWMHTFLSSKFALLSAEHIYLSGAFTEEDDLYYSNTFFKPVKTYTPKSSYYKVQPKTTTEKSNEDATKAKNTDVTNMLRTRGIHTACDKCKGLHLRTDLIPVDKLLLCKNCSISVAVQSDDIAGM